MTLRTSYCGYLGITVLHRLDGKEFGREAARTIKNGCGVDVFLSCSELYTSVCILASKHQVGVCLEEVEPYLGGIGVTATYYHGGLYNPTMYCEVREFDELDD